MLLSIHFFRIVVLVILIITMSRVVFTSRLFSFVTKYPSIIYSFFWLVAIVNNNRLR